MQSDKLFTRWIGEIRISFYKEDFIAAVIYEDEVQFVLRGVRETMPLHKNIDLAAELITELEHAHSFKISSGAIFVVDPKHIKFVTHVKPDLAKIVICTGNSVRATQDEAITVAMKSGEPCKCLHRF